MTPRPSTNVTRVTISELRLRLSEFVLRVWLDNGHIIIKRFGKPIAVIVPFEWYKEKTDHVDDPCTPECRE